MKSKLLRALETHNAKKTERRIEIGWLKYDEETGYKQVHKKEGEVRDISLHVVHQLLMS